MLSSDDLNEDKESIANLVPVLVEDSSAQGEIPYSIIIFMSQHMVGKCFQLTSFYVINSCTIVMSIVNEAE